MVGTGGGLKGQKAQSMWVVRASDAVCTRSNMNETLLLTTAVLGSMENIGVTKFWMMLV